MNEDSTTGINPEVEATDTVLSAYEAQCREPKIRNADNEWLGSPFPIAAVEEVNGPGAAELAGFVPTRHELLELARYWARPEWAVKETQCGNADDWGLAYVATAVLGLCQPKPCSKNPLSWEAVTGCTRDRGRQVQPFGKWVILEQRH